MPTSETARSWMSDAFNQLVKNFNTPNNKQLAKIFTSTHNQHQHQQNQNQKQSHLMEYDDEKILTSNIPKEQVEKLANYFQNLIIKAVNTANSSSVANNHSHNRDETNVNTSKKKSKSRKCDSKSDDTDTRGLTRAEFVKFILGQIGSQLKDLPFYMLIISLEKLKRCPKIDLKGQLLTTKINYVSENRDQGSRKVMLSGLIRLFRIQSSTDGDQIK
ncbi:unnamed protein product [Ambrosiozyma monospora]|uniref:Unnamed protein product n=1 Tax=Ambrosiozyma monospora TaxID=43982 RepID=A0A9W6SZT9_AMBMO|nr:unnamed protein product [Ambrosiozyma monospora]